MIHDQHAWSLNDGTAPRFYAYCSCGVCGPLRIRREDAERDDQGHAEVCSAKEAA